MSIKITPDKYPQIIEVYNTEGKTAAYDLMRSCYEKSNLCYEKDESRQESWI